MGKIYGFRFRFPTKPIHWYLGGPTGSRYYVISGSLLYHIVRPHRRSNAGVVEVFKGEPLGFYGISP